MATLSLRTSALLPRAARARIPAGVRFRSTAPAPAGGAAPLAVPRSLAFAFDIDGVLKQGHHVLPQARRTLQLLANCDGRLARPVPFLLMTNGGGVPDAERRAALGKDFGLELGDNQLVQSHTPLQAVVGQYRDRPVLCIGGPGDNARRVGASYGLKKAVIPQDIIHWRRSVWDKTDPPPDSMVRHDIDFNTTPIEAIFVLHDSHDWGRDLTIINELMQSEGGLLGTMRQDRFHQKDGGEVPLWFSNPDLEWKSDYPVVRLGMGAFRISVEAVYKACTGLQLPYHQYGKPHHASYDFANTMLDRQAKSLGVTGPLDVYMIGDNPLSDIDGANRYGWNSVLLRTGVYAGGEPAKKPTMIADDVELAVDWAWRNEIAKGKA